MKRHMLCGTKTEMMGRAGVREEATWLGGCYSETVGNPFPQGALEASCPKKGHFPGY